LYNDALEIIVNEKKLDKEEMSTYISNIVEKQPSVKEYAKAIIETKKLNIKI
jgi:hypothetical protein